MNSITGIDVFDEKVTKHPNWNEEKWGEYKVVALYKTFSGEEFVEASLQSIYRFCHKIVMVHSHVSWSGETGNTVIPVAREWGRKNDKKKKLIHLEGKWKSQDEQYLIGWTYIHKNIPEADILLLIDTDEIWDEHQLHTAISRVFVDNINHAWTVWMKSYIKSIFYKIDPPEWCKPTVFVKAKQPILGPRGAGIRPKDHLDNYLHHFTYVRSTEEQVMNKIKTSFIGDGPHVQCVSMDDWLSNKWDKLPFATDFHTTKTCEASWRGVKTVYTQDLPKEVWMNDKITEPYLPYTLMEGSDQELLLKYAEGKDLAVELGTFLGRGSVILSLKAKRVVTIDLFEDVANMPGFFYQNYPDQFKYTYQSVKESLWMYSNIEIIKGETVVEANKFKNKIDLLFIDADHFREGVERDYNAWFPLVKVGGIIMFHDYGDLWPGVREFVDTIGDELKFLEQVSTMRVCRKVRER